MNCWILWLDYRGHTLHQAHVDQAQVTASLEDVCHRVPGAVKVEIYITGRGKVREWPEATEG